MCAFNAAIDFSKDMIELSVATLGRLVAIQFADLTTFLEQQSDTMRRVADVHDVTGLLALQREYRGEFWNHRGAALVATRDVLQDASRSAAKSWTEWMSDGDSAAASAGTIPVSKKVELKPPAIEQAPAAASVSSASPRTMLRSADAARSKVRVGRSKTKRKSPAPATAGVPVTPPMEPSAPPPAKKRNSRPRKRPGGTAVSPTTPRSPSN